jgi:5-(carboxyamino)imidazole ribonucleotide synthase
MSLPSGLPVFPGTVSASGQPATLGVMGGGQLGRMFVHAAQRLGYFTAVLDPDAQSPAGLVSHHHIQTGYGDEQGLRQLAALCAAITTEFENVPAAALQALAVKCDFSSMRFCAMATAAPNRARWPASVARPMR